jgi:hypothetical protein
MTENNNEAQEATIDTLRDIVLEGASAYLHLVSNVPPIVADPIEAYVDGNGKIVITALYSELSTIAPQIVDALPKAETLSTYLDKTAIFLALLSAATKIATSNDPINELFKQGAIGDVSLAAGAATVTALEAFVGSTVFVGAAAVAAPVAIAVAGAVVAGGIGYALGQNWDTLVSYVQRGIANGLAPNDAASQAANEMASAAFTWLNQNNSGIDSAIHNSLQSAVQNPGSLQAGDGNTLEVNLGSDYVSQAESQLISQGYYVPLSGDNANSIAAQVQTDLGVSISGTELQRINAVFSGSHVQAGPGPL